MSEIFDYESIVKEMQNRLDNGLIPEEDKESVIGWLKWINSDIPKMKEKNAEFIINYLKKGKRREKTDTETINYREICNDIFSFLDTSKGLNDDLVEQLKAYISILSNDKRSDEEKKKISLKFEDIKRNINYQEKSRILLDVIEKKQNITSEFENRAYRLIDILLDDTRSLLDRKKADIEIDEILKLEKELLAVNSTGKRK